MGLLSRRDGDNKPRCLCILVSLVGVVLWRVCVEGFSFKAAAIVFICVFVNFEVKIRDIVKKFGIRRLTFSKTNGFAYLSY